MTCPKPSLLASIYVNLFGCMYISHRIHVWYIYLHEWLIFMVNVGKYTSPMDPMGIYIYATPAWKWKSHHPNKFKWPTNKTWSHPCPGKRWCLETGAALATIRRTGHTPRICLAVGIWLKSWRMKSPIPKRFFVFFLVGEQLIELIYIPTRGRTTDIFAWYLQLVWRFYDPYHVWNPLPETENSIEILSSLQECQLWVTIALTVGRGYWVF